jgi:hypothetical protein
MLHVVKNDIVPTRHSLPPLSSQRPHLAGCSLILASQRSDWRRLLHPIELVRLPLSSVPRPLLPHPHDRLGMGMPDTTHVWQVDSTTLEPLRPLHRAHDHSSDP